ncbi:MAG: hypothetical protein F6K11_01815 [Leptolyngbya sp. SIO3F4]|nr:hypothetical protein [Leptolyngbya sp. SIO3F4]
MACAIGIPPSWAASPEAQVGVLDLRNEGLERGEAIELHGEWEFYWNQLLTPADFSNGNPQLSFYTQVPSIWKGQTVNDTMTLPGTGYGTYRLKVLLPKNSGRLAIKMLSVGTSIRVFANDSELVEVGNVSTDPDLAVADYRPQVLDLDVPDGELDLIVQISNYDYHLGGFWRSFHIARESVLRDWHEQSLFFDYFVIGALFMLGFYHMGLFLLRTRERWNGYYGAASVLAAIRIACSGEYILSYFPWMPWELIIRLEFLSFYLGMAVLTLYIHALFERDFHRYVRTTVLIVAGICTLIVIFTPPLFFSHTVNFYQLFSMGVLAYCIFAVFRAVVRKRMGSYIFAFGFSLLAIAIANDIMLNYYFEVFDLRLIGVGLLLFMLNQSYLLAFRFTRTLKANEELSANLAQINNDLELTVADRTQELQNSLTSLQDAKEEIQQKNAELEAANRTKDKFFSIIGHDLRGPMGGIKMSLELLADDMQDEDVKREEMQKSLSILARSANSAFALLENLFDWSRSQTGDLRFEPSVFTLLDVVHENLSLLADKLERKEQVTVTNIASEIRVFADRNMVSTVIRNLLSNANKFTERKGTIRVTAFEINGQIETQIADTGIGIAPDRIDALFEYSRNKSTQGTEKERGTGIGLALCKEFIERNGGRIAATSEINVGTTFIFTLPKARTSQE